MQEISTLISTLVLCSLWKVRITYQRDPEHPIFWDDRGQPHVASKTKTFTVKLSSLLEHGKSSSVTLAEVQAACKYLYERTRCDENNGNFNLDAFLNQIELNYSGNMYGEKRKFSFNISKTTEADRALNNICINVVIRDIVVHDDADVTKMAEGIESFLIGWASKKITSKMIKANTKASDRVIKLALAHLVGKGILVKGKNAFDVVDKRDDNINNQDNEIIEVDCGSIIENPPVQKLSDVDNSHAMMVLVPLVAQVVPFVPGMAGGGPVGPCTKGAATVFTRAAVEENLVTETTTVNNADHGCSNSSVPPAVESEKGDGEQKQQSVVAEPSTMVLPQDRDWVEGGGDYDDGHETGQAGDVLARLPYPLPPVSSLMGVSLSTTPNHSTSNRIASNRPASHRPASPTSRMSTDTFASSLTSDTGTNTQDDRKNDKTFGRGWMLELTTTTTTTTTVKTVAQCSKTRM